MTEALLAGLGGFVLGWIVATARANRRLAEARELLEGLGLRGLEE